jgi:uncharacterized protein YjbJ (UPF0337 family)
LQEAIMTKFREKAQARTMQVVGQMIGDDQLVQEGKEQEAETQAEASGDHDEQSKPDRKAPSPKTNGKWTRRGPTNM